VVLLCCGVNRLIGSLSSIERLIAVIAVMQCKRVVGMSSTSLAQILLLWVCSFSFFKVDKQVLLCMIVGGEGTKQCHGKTHER